MRKDAIGHFKGQGAGTVIADRYRIIREVGVGTFGRVVECLDLKKTGRASRKDRQENVVAIKIVRNVKRYYDSALIEADIVEDVNRRGGRGVSHCAKMLFDAPCLYWPALLVLHGWHSRVLVLLHSTASF